MKASEIEQITTAVKEHIIDGLEFLYIAAGVGDNRLHIKPVAYSDGADYQIVAIDMDFGSDPKGEMVYYQVEAEPDEELNYDEDDEESEFEKQLIKNLPIEELQNLLAATEKRVNWHYDSEFVLPQTKEA